MPWYETSYIPPLIRDKVLIRGGAYGCHFFAKNWLHAEELVKQRNLNEHIFFEWETKDFNYPDPYPLPSAALRELYHLTEHQRLVFLHGLSFLGNIAIKSGVAVPEEIVGDEGIVHEAIHQLQIITVGQNPTTHDAQKFKRNLIDLEQKVPGFWRPVT